ncbi:E3 ubiquitin-protein ligase NRDP1-like [Adelges cooleyi]|uniref:E3 ubiquitin-protein ligase NRDP1-like n=1 Tax=Adelges cooleyi TaxID=133065 RepID=UPI00217F7C98|nr:E3 ubiquitin-protein ligase NRDP1-like [Adelges cooleyi]
MCLTYYILAANSMDSLKETVEGESSTSEVMLEWPKNLQPIKVPEIYWRKIVPHPKQMPTLKQALEDRKCPPDIVPRYQNRCTEDSWPVGLKTPTARAENRSMFTQYKCR